MNRKSSKKSFFSKPLVLVCLAILLIAGTIGATVAFLTSTGSVTNTFSPASVEVEIHETMNLDKTQKNDVAIENKSDIPAYLRVAVVYSWQDENNNVVPVLPVDRVDYEITNAEGFGENWELKSDGFYYSKSEVQPDTDPVPLFTSIKLLDSENAAKYHLHVEILAEAIQAAGTGAKADAWE